MSMADDDGDEYYAQLGSGSYVDHPDDGYAYEECYCEGCADAIGYAAVADFLNLRMEVIRRVGLSRDHPEKISIRTAMERLGLDQAELLDQRHALLAEAERRHQLMVNGVALDRLERELPKGMRYTLSWNPVNGRYGVNVRGSKHHTSTGGGGATIAEAADACTAKLRDRRCR